jgi:hypothetical protein
MLMPGKPSRPEIEDLLRETLISVAKEDLGWDVTAKAAEQPEQPLVELFAAEINGFSKYKLAKAYLRWTRDHKASDLAADERSQGETLLSSFNAALR